MLQKNSRTPFCFSLLFDFYYPIFWNWASFPFSYLGMVKFFDWNTNIIFLSLSPTSKRRLSNATRSTISWRRWRFRKTLCSTKSIMFERRWSKFGLIWIESVRKIRSSTSTGFSLFQSFHLLKHFKLSEKSIVEIKLTD